MLDIIPYVCVTVNAHVLLFKPRVGTNMGARPAARRMRRKPSAFRACRAARAEARRRLPRASHAVCCSVKRHAPLVCTAAHHAAADGAAAARHCAVGRVNMVGADHVGLLVCNAFNVSISRENIRKDLRFVETVRPSAAPCHGALAHRARHRPLAATTARGLRAHATARTSSAAAWTCCSQ
jgi:hypothetical protein